jgi:uncharacterized membrane protein
MSKDPQHWKFWVFYYNPDDPRLFTRKTGFRWTVNPFKLNFARRGAWIVAGASLVLLIVLAPFNHDPGGFLRAIRHLLSNTP